MQRYSLKTMARRKGIRRDRIIIRPPRAKLALQHKLDRIASDAVLGPFRQYREMLLREAAADRPTMTQDSMFDVLRLFRAAYDRLIEAARYLLRPVLAEAAKSHTSEWNAAINKAIGINLEAVIDKADVRPHVDLAVERHIALIKGLTEEVQKRLATVLTPMITHGQSTKAIAGAISKEFGFARKRAAIIARDQAAKFNGDLNRVRQVQAGITTYQWATSMDERVRGNPDGRYPNAAPSHWDREGKVFRWDKPPADGHPGEPIMCRCVAIAVIT